jgi:hypothetical protein
MVWIAGNFPEGDKGDQRAQIRLAQADTDARLPGDAADDGPPPQDSSHRTMEAS